MEGQVLEWQKALLKYGEIAINTGQELTFSVIKRQEFIKWRISLKELVEHGEEETIED